MKSRSVKSIRSLIIVVLLAGVGVGAAGGVSSTALGVLNFLEAKVDDPGLRRARSVAVSPDGAHVYVAGTQDDAVVVFTSDHGDMMGSFRVDRKGPIPYDPVYRIPLVVRVPDEAPARTTVDDLVSNVSLPGTLAEAAGLPVPPEFRGGSLLPVLRRRAPPEDEMVFFEHYSSRWGLHPFRAVRTRDWKYVRYYGPDDTEELIHVAEDPGEVGNLAGDPDAEPVREHLAAALERWWEETGGRDFAYYESEEFKASGGELTISPRE